MDSDARRLTLVPNCGPDVRVCPDCRNTGVPPGSSTPCTCAEGVELWHWLEDQIRADLGDGMWINEDPDGRIA